MDAMKLLRERLEACLSPEHLEIEDESARHRGHPGATGGRHFRVVVVSAAFRDHDQLSRQRAVYAAVGDAMHSEIHALALRTLTPEEWKVLLDTGGGFGKA